MKHKRRLSSRLRWGRPRPKRCRLRSFWRRLGTIWRQCIRELVQWTKLFAYSNETYESKDWIRHLGLIKDQTNKTGFKFQRGPRGHGILAPFWEIESKDEKHNLKFWHCLQRFFFTSPRPFMMIIQYPKLYPLFSCVHECLSSLRIYLFIYLFIFIVWKWNIWFHG